MTDFKVLLDKPAKTTTPSNEIAYMLIGETYETRRKMLRENIVHQPHDGHVTPPPFFLAQIENQL